MHVALRPGTDVVLAWALAAELERRGAFDRDFIARHVHGFDEFMAQARRHGVAQAAEICGIPEAQIRTLAEWYATISPAAINVGNGLERNQNGGSGIRAVFALPALAGKFGVAASSTARATRFRTPRTGCDVPT
jgi:anaerobic selenocysteine-containing dehydrogenase